MAAPDPVPDDLENLIKADLEQSWRFNREVLFRRFVSFEWGDVSNNVHIALDDTVGPLSDRMLKFCCNKPTAVYFLNSTQGYSTHLKQQCVLSTNFFAAVYAEWFRHYNGEPSIDFGHFFANPVRISSIGPSTVSGIIDAHLSIYKQARTRIDSLGGFAGHILSSPSIIPECYRLHPLYQAIVVIVDRLDGLPENGQQTPGISQGEYTRRQTMLIVRTGAQDGLSAPISFDSLMSKPLPVDAPALEDRDVDMVRVPLPDGIQFVTDLYKREHYPVPLEFEQALGAPGSAPGFEDGGQHRHRPETWADAVVQSAPALGFNNVDHDLSSTRNVLAQQAGSRDYAWRHVPFCRAWLP